MNPEEIRKIEAYLRSKFELASIQVRARPRKDDSAEVYIGEEFIGVIFRDDEDEDDDDEDEEEDDDDEEDTGEDDESD